MKKINLSFILIIATFITAFSQVPNAFNYQAVVRSSSGEIISNQSVSFKISILEDSESGTAVYSETHTLSTNEFGLANFEIGSGENKTGTFAPDGWGASPHFIKLEFDPAGGNSFSHLATSKLVSVPYAFHAETVSNDKVDDADADPANEIQTLSLNGTLLELSNGGGSVTLPTSGGSGGDNWGAQVVKTDETLTGDGTSGNELHVVADGDSDDTNELQTLSVSGNDLTISGGNTVALPNSSLWEMKSDKLYYGAGRIEVGNWMNWTNVLFGVTTNEDIIGIGVSNSGNHAPLYAINNGSGPAAEFDGRIQIFDGTQGEGKVLTSDATGNTSWQTPASGGSSLWTQSDNKIYYTAGNVGIGTIHPTDKLHIDNGNIKIGYGGRIILENSNQSSTISTKDNDMYLSNFAAGNIILHTKTDPATNVPAAARLKISAAGDVTVYENLLVSKNITIEGGTPGLGKVLTSDANGLASWQTPASGGSSLWTESGGNIYRSSGNVGIGTSSPSAPLEIKSNEANALIIGSASANYPNRPGIQFKNNTSQFISGDDGSDEIFGFYSKWSSTRAYNAKLRVYGNASSSWGKYIQLTHDGTDGIISTDVGDIELNPNSGNVKVDGKITSASSGSNDMKAYAYGFVQWDGTLKANSGNVSVSRTATGKYTVTLTGQTYNDNNFVAVFSHAHSNKSLGHEEESGKIKVYIELLSGSYTDASFSFVIYKM